MPSTPPDHTPSPPATARKPTARRIAPDGRQAQALERIAALREGRDEGGSVDFSGLRLVGEDLSKLDLSGAALSGADLSRCNLTETNLFGARLTGATLFQANLTGAELSGADLTGANLTGATLVHAGLGRAELGGAKLATADLHGATLTGASLRDADVSGANLESVRMREADLGGGNFSMSDLRHAELDQSAVGGAVFDGADLRDSSLVGLQGYDRASWIGVDLREIDFTGAYMLRRFIMDENFLDEFRKRSRWSRAVYELWHLTSDCGRSVTRWSFCTGALVFLFAWLHSMVGVDYGDYPTPISPLYYSVVTLTTLGFGDVTPSTSAGQAVAMLEVVTGYVMLGGLLSIFSNKMATRAS